MIDFRKGPLLCVSKVNCFLVNVWLLVEEVHFLSVSSRIQGLPLITFQFSTVKVLTKVLFNFDLND